MYGTSLEGIEQLMVMVPNFQPRRSGIVINNYFNCRGGDGDCKLSVINVDYSCKDCEHIGSNFKINVDRFRYKDLVRECFGKINNYLLKEKLKNLTNKFKGEIFLNLYFFLITADEGLWKSSENIISQGKCDLKQICLREIKTDGYALYQSAKTLSTGKECIKINELADKELIDDFIFKAIINSALDISQNLDCYDYLPKTANLERYGRLVADRDKIVKEGSILGDNFDYVKYAKADIEKEELVSCKYGLIKRNGEKFHRKGIARVYLY